MDEQTQETETETEIRGVVPPQGRMGYVLNGISNGAIFGSALLFSYEMYNQAKRGEMKNPVFAAGLGLTVVGCAVGAYFGLQEAKQLNSYRAALAKDLDSLHAKIDGHSAHKSR